VSESDEWVRSEWGRQGLRDLCSVVATGRLIGRAALAVIRDAHAHPPTIT
jgi:hypothetical protein